MSKVFQTKAKLLKSQFFIWVRIDTQIPPSNTLPNLPLPRLSTTKQQCVSLPHVSPLRSHIIYVIVNQTR